MIRRDVLRLGGAAAFATLLPAATQARAGAKPALALFDGRYSDARLFADAARARGASALDTAGDVASLWHGAGFARGDGSAILGLTTYADLLMMGDLARSMGLKQSFRAMHDARGSAEVRHLLQDATIRAPGLCAGTTWPIALADCVTGEGGAAGRDAQSGPRSSDHPGTLWSWMYEPL